MFGFGKKQPEKKDDKTAISQTQLASECLNIIWRTKEETFKELSSELAERWDIKYQHAGQLMFFLEASAYDADFMGYNMGFIFGMGQAYTKSDEFCYEALHQFVLGYEKTISNYIDQLNLQQNPKPYSELFSVALEDKVLVDSENGS